MYHIKKTKKKKHWNLTCSGMSGTIVTSSCFLTPPPSEQLQTTLITAVPEEVWTDISSYVCAPLNMTITIKTIWQQTTNIPFCQVETTCWRAQTIIYFYKQIYFIFIGQGPNGLYGPHLEAMCSKPSWLLSR